MCESCVKEEYPDRGTLCLDSGAYLANLVCCQGCGKKDSLIINNRISNSVENCCSEDIEYKHVCGECNHVVALHSHHFHIEDTYQHYEMNCMLCGFAEDMRSCLPEDPRYVVEI